MNWNKSIRQIHRWFSMAFAVAVIVNVVAIVQKKYSAAVGLLAVAPLAFLFLTGLYLFRPAVCRQVAQRIACKPNRRLTSCAFGGDQRDVVRLFVRAEPSSLIGNCDQPLRWG